MPQVYEYSIVSDTINQLTQSTSGFIIVDRLATDESRVYIRGVSNLTGANSSGLHQGFSLDLHSGELEQITNYTGSSPIILAGRFSADGNTFIQVNGNTLERIDTSKETFSLNIETGAGEEGLIETSLDALTSVLSGLGGLTIATRGEALGALENSLSNIDQLGSLSSQIGASMSRLASANDMLYAQSEAKQAARARIMDADVAAEVAELTKLQIQQQVAAGLMAQINLTRSVVLQLLGIDT